MVRLPIGTRSLLFGAHQVALHPLFVALAWRRLYGGWPRKVPIWVAFFLHDIGYWGCESMDGDDGLQHPERGAAILSALFDDHWWTNGMEWYLFSATHSRSYAKEIDFIPGPLMAADKLATVLMPLWLYAGLCWLSGEWREYRQRWIDAGTYPGRPDDGVLTWARHLRANWRRFERADALAGKAYGGE